MLLTRNIGGRVAPVAPAAKTTCCSSAAAAAAALAATAFFLVNVFTVFPTFAKDVAFALAALLLCGIDLPFCVPLGKVK